MFSWSGIPFTRFTIALSLGILISFFLLPAANYTLLASIAVAVYIALFILQRSNRKISYSLRPVLGATALLSLFFIGALLVQNNDEHFHPNHLINQKRKITYYEAIIASAPEAKENTYKAEAEVIQVKNKNWMQAEGKVILYLSKENYKSLQYGDKIIARGSPSEIKPPLNPGEFNYKEYARRHHLYLSHFLKSNDYYLISRGNGNPIISIAYSLRRKAQKVIAKYIPSSTEQGIATALILGLKGTMDPDLMEIYSNTGTTHVLAVSGLHVAIVFQILVTVFFFFNSSKSKNSILPIILLAGLWLYVLVTGLCPSVLRAGLMFSIVIIAKALKRNSNTYNNLFLSAFLLLCIDPLLLLDTGFQLSYLAVFGVIYFTDPIYQLIEVDNYIMDKIWMTSAMSFAAQITTLPITIFYFHQIPLSFLIANLIAIPISSLILYSGTLLLCVSFSDTAGTCVGYVTEKLIWLMNKALYYISEVPFSALKGLSLSIQEIIIIYLSVLITALFLRFKKIIYLKLLTIFVLLLTLSFVIKNIRTKNQERFIVFNIPNEFAIGFLKGDHAIIYTDSITTNSKKFTKHIQPYLEERNIKNVLVNQENNFVQKTTKEELTVFTFSNKSFLRINKNNYQNLSIPGTDFAIIHPESKIEFEKINTRNKILLNAKRPKSFITSLYDYDLKGKPAFEVLF